MRNNTQNREKNRISVASLVLIFLVLIGVTPLITFFLFTQKKVVTELQHLEEEQHLHHLQDDLRVLEAKIESYQNMIGFVSQLPAVFEILDEGKELIGAIDQKTALKRYTGVLSRAFKENNDVINIHILDKENREKFSLVRNPLTLKYEQVATGKFSFAPSLQEKVLQMENKEFFLTPLTESKGDPVELKLPRLILQILTPIFFKGQKIGIFLSDIDIGILTKNLPEINWVRNNGNFLSSGETSGNAFVLFPGVEKVFQSGHAGVWKKNNNIMVWDPFFKGDNVSLTLWAGKEITLNTVKNTSHNILMSGVRIFLILLTILLLISSLFAKYIKKASTQFTNNLKQSIFQKENVFPRSKNIIQEFSEFSHNLDHILEQNKILEEERQKTLADLKRALDEVKTLRGILPICSYCKNVRNDDGYYEQIESYIHKHSAVDFSHTICPLCAKKHHPEVYKRLIENGKIKN